MGITLSTDIRRISFENSLATNSGVLIEKTIEDHNPFPNNLDGELINKLTSEDKIRRKDVQDDDYIYWSGRIESLKNEHKLITKIIEEEYEKTIDTTTNFCEQPKVSQDHIKKIQPCYTWRAKMLQCYEKNPQQSLVCSPVVKEFNKYIESCRVAK